MARKAIARSRKSRLWTASSISSSTSRRRSASVRSSVMPAARWTAAARTADTSSLSDRGDRALPRSDVLRRGSDQPPGALLLEDVSRPAGDPGASEHGGRQVGWNLGKVEDNGRIKLDVRGDHVVRLSLAQLGQCGLFECLGDLETRRSELLRRPLQDARARVLGPVNAMAEAHDLPVAVEDLFDVGLRVPRAGYLVQHRQHAGRSAAVERAAQRTYGNGPRAT